MQALIFADRSGRDLHPIDEQYCPALLPLGNRPVLEYSVLNVVSAGITEIILVISSQADRIESHFAKGAMWGVEIDYVLSRGEENPDAVLVRIQKRLKPPFLALRGDVFHSVSITEFLARGRTLPGPATACQAGGRSLGICLANRWPASLKSLSWPLTEGKAELEQVIGISGWFSRLDSLQEYHAATMKSLDDIRPDPALGELAGDRAFRVERLAHVKPRNHESGRVLVGERTLVRNSARLEGPCVIGRHCLIDERVRIRNSVVLPSTYVGTGLLLENAIVAGELLVRVDHDSHVRIRDRHMVSNVAQEMSALAAQLPESLVAGVLLMLSAPLWPIALVFSLLKSPRKPGQWRYVLNNRPRFRETGTEAGVSRAWFWASEIPLLRNLALPWLVVKGDLRLFGKSFEPASTVDSNLLQDPCCQAGQATAGLLGPAHLYLSAGAPEEEIRLNEIEFVERHGWLTLCGRLLSATKLLFRGRTWRPVIKSDSEH